MCRLLLVKSKAPFEPQEHLSYFADVARGSKVYQGHGWGCAWISDGRWHLYRSVRPIWEDDLIRFGPTHFLIAHARSAFRDEGIDVTNNMPFSDGTHVFVFNGELRGVRIREEGRIGAEKIFNFIRRFDRGDMGAAILRGVGAIEARSASVRAMNFIVADSDRAYVSSRFTDDPEYFTLRMNRNGRRVIVCSEEYPASAPWTPVRNGSIEVVR